MTRFLVTRENGVTVVEPSDEKNIALAPLALIVHATSSKLALEAGRQLQQSLIDQAKAEAKSWMEEVNLS